MPVLSFCIPIIKLTNKKFREREGVWEDILENLNIDHNAKKIWFHAASMGEFEQAKPVIEMIKKQRPDIKIVVTFFSPSGYNNQKNYQYADYIAYLPFDFRYNVKYFLDKIKPDFAVFIRYEIWRNYLEILNKSEIKTFLICATKPNKKILYTNPLIKKFTISNYSFFTKIFTVSEEQTKFFKELDVKTEINTSADTRLDRIYENVIKFKTSPLLPKELFLNQFVLIGGSTWIDDEKILIETVIRLQKEGNINIKLIIVPHEPTINHLSSLKQLLPHSFLLSEVEGQINNFNDNDDLKNYLGKNHLIVDSIGKLLKLYSLADAVYVGGGFGAGVHSVTEPAGYGIPIACGPKYYNSYDAVQLVSRESLKVINCSDDLYKWLKKLMNNKDLYTKLSKINEEYVINQLGESQKIANEIINNFIH